MIGMSIKLISALNLCHVLKPFVKSTPGELSEMRAIAALIYLFIYYKLNGAISKIARKVKEYSISGIVLLEINSM